ncbi:MAG: DUF6261 family protein [Tannerellaceae bacterium]|jgi:hypothetical protein|nr:DUF6261 family protein [Tannerellaceae bacterium]
MIAIQFHTSFPGKLRNAEHFDMYKNIRDAIAARALKPLSLLTPWNAFDRSFAKEDVIYKRYFHKIETRHVTEAHENRRIRTMGLKRTLEAGTYNIDPLIKKAAEDLLEVMNNYADILRSPMTEVTAMIFNMIQDMELPKYAADSALVPGAAATIALLEQANNAFNELYLERTGKEEDMKTEGSLSGARRQTDFDGGYLFEAINTFYHANEMSHPKDPEVSAVLSAIIHDVNAIIHRYEAIYARRNPKWRPGSSGKPSTPGDNDTIPSLTISSQAIVGERMALRASDAATFASILYPAAEDGVVHIISPETETFVDFPIARFEMDVDNVTPIGLLVEPPAANETFDKPFYGFDIAETNVSTQDGETLATLEGVKYPSMTRDD